MLAEYFPWVVVDPSHSSALPAMAVIAVGYRPSLAVQRPKPLAAPWPDWRLASHSRPRPITRATSGSPAAANASPEGTARPATSRAQSVKGFASITKTPSRGRSERFALGPLSRRESGTFRTASNGPADSLAAAVFSIVLSPFTCSGPLPLGTLGDQHCSSPRGRNDRSIPPSGGGER